MKELSPEARQLVEKARYHHLAGRTIVEALGVALRTMTLTIPSASSLDILDEATVAADEAGEAFGISLASSYGIDYQVTSAILDAVLGCVEELTPPEEKLYVFEVQLQGTYQAAVKASDMQQARSLGRASMAADVYHYQHHGNTEIKGVLTLTQTGLYGVREVKANLATGS